MIRVKVNSKSELVEDRERKFALYRVICCCDDRLSRAIEFSFYLNFNYILKIEATCSINRIIKSGCNLIARKRLDSTKIL